MYRNIQSARIVLTNHVCYFHKRKLECYSMNIFLLFQPSKTQLSINLIPTGSILFLFLISFVKCNTEVLKYLYQQLKYLYQNEYLLNAQIVCENSD